MATAVTQFHEEEAIGKTYDFQVARRLLRYLKPYLRLLTWALILTLVLNLLGILQPKFTQYAIDWYILPRKTDGLILLVALFTGVQLLRLVFSYFQAVLLNTVGQFVMFDIRRELYDKLQHQEIAYYDRNPVGRIMTRLTTDVDSLNELFTQGVTDLLGDLVMIVAIIAVMLWMDVRLTLITLLTVPLLFAATTWFRKGARRGYDARDVAAADEAREGRILADACLLRRHGGDADPPVRGRTPPLGYRGDLRRAVRV